VLFGAYSKVRAIGIFELCKASVPPGSESTVASINMMMMDISNYFVHEVEIHFAIGVTSKAKLVTSKD
jgi:hypothetical protein